MFAAVEINPAAVIVAAIAQVIIGALWFNAPFLFQKTWLAGIGKTAEQVAEDASPVNFVVAIVGALVTALILSIVVDWAGATDIVQGALVGLIVGIGMVAVLNGIRDVFEGRPRSLFLVNASHDILVLVVAGAVIGLLG